MKSAPCAAAIAHSALTPPRDSHKMHYGNFLPGGKTEPIPLRKSIVCKSRANDRTSKKTIQTKTALESAAFGEMNGNFCYFGSERFS